MSGYTIRRRYINANPSSERAFICTATEPTIMVLKESESELDRGDVAPDFDLLGTDGKQYSLNSFEESDALLIVFTCNHCPYAKAKFDLLNELAAEYDDAAIVGINPNANEEYPDDSYDRMVELVEDGTIAYDAYLYDERTSKRSVNLETLFVKFY